jgi:hypothetical protein
MNSHPYSGRHNPAFSLIELVIVAAVGAVVFTTGALAYRVVAKNQRTVGAFQEVALPAGVGDNFYPGASLTSVDSYTAPNFGRCSQADVMRTLFLEEVEKSVAVFVLPRGLNTNAIRGRTINLYGTLPQSLDTPAAFLEFLKANADTTAAAQVFTAYRGAPPDSSTTTTTSTDADGNPVNSTTTSFVTNASIFLIQPSGSNGQLWVRSVYEIDYVGLPVDANDPAAPDVPCVFASVRRYVDNTLTHYYDVVYREAGLDDVGVPCAHFERRERVVYTESGVDAFKKAANQPFYLIWWPDPGVQRLKGTAATSYSAGTPQAAYAKHEGQTTYVFVIPQFPAL